MSNSHPPRKGNRGVSQNRRGPMIVGAISAAVIVAALVVAAIANSGGGSAKTADTVSSSEAESVVATISSVPAASFDAVGKGSVKSDAAPVNGTALSVGGKPEVLYVGAEFCPFCAAERWPLYIALARFGTFTGVGLTHSSSTDVYPNTATLSFHGSSYTSEVLAFTPVEVATNQPDGSGGYTPLDTPTAAQQAAVAQLSPGGGIPFIDFAGRFLISGATYDPGVLQGVTATQIATALRSPDSAVAKAVLGTANSITATLCQLTGNKPAAVCT